ncbi:sensor histidine kinase [Methylophaga sp. OBS4]|uniref:sensor histidine kinase n=1 Tax=Methylophaga sp. OBS4 TaxID=2991935 RepID=UPI002254C260|nr:sensor histidine kinase [Methylophaga sp. OBS4]MCX4187777.1 sensor histidine kinase [Methylophaga sp. OBS4]
MSLRNLINLRIALSVLLILILGGVMAIWQARQSVERELQASFNLALQMVKSEVNQADMSQNSDDWLQSIKALRHSRHLQISLIDNRGEVTEILTASEHEEERTPPAWFIAAVMTDYLQVDYSVDMTDGSVKRIRISADPMDEILEAWNESQAYFWSIVLMMVVIFVAINVVFHSMLRAVGTILSGLRQVESGEYGGKLPAFKISEFDAIASEINNLSEALNLARQNNQALARHTMHIQENERQHMSRELHDEMGQSLTAVKAMSVASKQANADVPVIADSIIEICNHLSGVVRSMMRTLHPLSLADLGLGATLTDLVNEWRRRHADLVVTLDYDNELESLSHEVAIHVYRIVQECLTNVVRHAQADKVKVTVRRSRFVDNSQVVISVEDNGIGGHAEGEGFGVRAMRERVENLGGRFSFESRSGQGVSVKARMPFIEKQQDEPKQD